MDEDYIAFDRTKFKSVVHYVCSRCRPDELGNVKLHKILYYADMISFAGSGVPLTGADYVKQKFGPTARHLAITLRELVREGNLEVRDEDYFGFSKRVFASLAPPKMTNITNSDARLLNDVIDFVCRQSAKEISEFSHDVAWKTALMGERIPYAAALDMQPAEITDEDISSATAELARIWPSIEAERRANSYN